MDFMLLSFCKANEAIASHIAAYSLGKQESTAAINLLQKIPGEIKESLTLLVRQG